MRKKRALITGITGQDGSYLAELLLNEDYRVYGIERRSSQKNRGNIAHILDKITLFSGDLLDEASLVHALKKAELDEGDEVFNLASQSFVKESWDQPVYTGEVTGLGVLRMLEAIRQVNPSIKFYQASSSEMFGAAKESPQNEQTPFYPRSPYGIAKLFAHWATVNYRESYNMFAVSGILFNHESPRRGIEFVTKKIAVAAAEIKFNLAKKLAGKLLELGDITPRRDWGYAPDYVEAMWRMLQQKEPEDFVIATGVQHSVRDFAEAAFAYVGLDWEKFVILSSEFLRPAEVYHLCGDTARAREKLGWQPEIDFPQLVGIMMDHEIRALKNRYKI